MALRLKIVSDNAAAAGDHPRWTFGVNGGRIGRNSSNDWVLRDPDRVPGVFPISSSWMFILFGLGAIQFAKHPEGLLEPAAARRHEARRRKGPPPSDGQEPGGRRNEEAGMATVAPPSTGSVTPVM